MSIELMRDKTTRPVYINIHEIQKVEEGYADCQGRMYPYTDVIYGPIENARCVRVVESANEIGRKIIEALKNNDADIIITERK